MVASPTEVLATAKLEHGYAVLLRQRGVIGLCFLSAPPEAYSNLWNCEIVPVEVAKRLVELAELADAG